LYSNYHRKKELLPGIVSDNHVTSVTCVLADSLALSPVLFSS
jgi:hypothetical protein